MKTDKVLFAGRLSALPHALPLRMIMNNHEKIRDAIAATAHVSSPDICNTVANASFVYSFNAYKCVGMLLAERYYESASAILRQIWEVSVNLHWMAKDPEKRVLDFCNFTVIENRKIIEQLQDPMSLSNYDLATKQFQARHQFSDKKGKVRFKSSFSGTNTFDRAAELGKEWVDEYRTIYQLGSLQVHGAPGAVLHTVFMSQYPDAKFREKNMIALTSLMATKVMVRNVELLKETGIIPDASLVMKEFQKFTRKLSKSLKPKGTSGSKDQSQKLDT